jgi:hypothetical protein
MYHVRSLRIVGLYASAVLVVTLSPFCTCLAHIQLVTCHAADAVNICLVLCP